MVQIVQLCEYDLAEYIDNKTATAWISLLESTYVIFRLQPYYKNNNKRLIKSPKLYFVDTGIACSLLNIKSAEEIFSHYAYGSLVESYIISDFYKQYYNHDKRPSLYFWRDYQGNEIDCIVEKAMELTPIEIKGGQTVNQAYFKQFDYWDTIIKNTKEKFVVYTGSENQNWPTTKVIGWEQSGTLIHEIDN